MKRQGQKRAHPVPKQLRFPTYPWVFPKGSSLRPQSGDEGHDVVPPVIDLDAYRERFQTACSSAHLFPQPTHIVADRPSARRV